MTRQTVRPKRSKKQQREVEAKRRERGRSRQAAFVARKKGEGRSLVRVWVTDEEKAVLKKMILMLPELVQMDREKSVRPNEGGPPGEKC